MKLLRNPAGQCWHRLARVVTIVCWMLLPYSALAAQGCGIPGLLAILDPVTRSLVNGLLNLTCTASAQPVSFGNHNPITHTPTLANGTIQVSCNLSLLSGLVTLPPLLVCYDIALSRGTGSYAQRTMRDGANTFQYNLYTTDSLSAVWGDGSSGTAVVSDSFLLSLGNGGKSYTVYGRISPSQSPLPTTFNDTVSVTISY